MADEVLTERRDAALWLRLNRPETLNGLTPTLLDALDAGLDTAAADDDVRAVVLAARGRVFCAGADLKYARSLLPTGRRSSYGGSAARWTGSRPSPSRSSPPCKA